MSFTERQSESQAPVVPKAATQGAEAHRTWVEASVWNERMLAALKNGVKGGKWFSLIDKVSSALAKYILRGPGTVHHGCSLGAGEPIPMRKPPTGEPCAGEPHARFGGRGRREPFPTPIDRRPSGYVTEILRHYTRIYSGLFKSVKFG